MNDPKISQLRSRALVKRSVDDEGYNRHGLLNFDAPAKLPARWIEIGACNRTGREQAK